MALSAAALGAVALTVAGTARLRQVPQHLHPGLVVETALSAARRAGLR